MNDRVEIRANTTVDALDMPMARTRRGVLLGLCCCVALLTGFIKSATAQDIVDPAKVYEIVYGATLDPKTGLGKCEPDPQTAKAFGAQYRVRHAQRPLPEHTAFIANRS